MSASNTRNISPQWVKASKILAIVCLVNCVIFAFLTWHVFDHSFEYGQGSGDGQFLAPRGIAVSSTGYVYVVDAGNHRVQVFTATGQFVTKWGSDGSDPGQFKNIRGIAINSTGYVHVLEEASENNRLQVFTAMGKFVTEWTVDDYAQFVAVNSSGYVYVQGVKLQIFNPVGQLVSAFILSGGSIAINDSGSLFIAHGFGFGVYTPTGEEVARWEEYGNETGQLEHVTGIAVGDSEQVFITDDKSNRVQVFTPEGHYINGWGMQGIFQGQFDVPFAIAVSPTTGMVYVADYYNSRVQAFTADGQFVTEWGSYIDGLVILFTLISIVSLTVTFIIIWYRRRVYNRGAMHKNT